MTISYVTFMKHAAKVTKTASAGRPVLKGVHHKTDGSLAVTDSHRLYYAENTYETSEDAVKNPKTGEIIEGNYPGVSRLIPSDNEWFTVELDVSLATRALKAMATVVKTNNNENNSQVRFAIIEGKLVITAGDEGTSLNMTYNAGIVSAYKNDEVKAAVNVNYLYESIDLLRDLGYTKTTLKFYGNMRPLTIGNTDITTLMLPVRGGY